MEGRNKTLECTKWIDAPRELIFKAWTNPNHLAYWWGPEGFTNTFHEFDLRPGGYWRFTMHGPNGKNYDNESCFVEITAPERFIFDHISPPHFRLEGIMKEKDAGTEVTFRQIFNTVETFEKIKDLIAGKNEENMERLEREVERMKHL